VARVIYHFVAGASSGHRVRVVTPLDFAWMLNLARARVELWVATNHLQPQPLHRPRFRQEVQQTHRRRSKRGRCAWTPFRARRGLSLVGRVVSSLASRSRALALRPDRVKTTGSALATPRSPTEWLTFCVLGSKAACFSPTRLCLETRVRANRIG
jgi:hypothetical protein